MLYLVQDSTLLKRVQDLVGDRQGHVVMGGVLAGLQAGRVYVDHSDILGGVLIWARHEMFYWIGDPDGSLFHTQVKKLLREDLLPEALRVGEEMLNLELLPTHGGSWDSTLQVTFAGKLGKGYRIPFTFDQMKFNHWLQQHACLDIPPQYQVSVIDATVLEEDTSGVIQEEILKFWYRVEDFIRYGLGTCVILDGQVVGTCLSVFVSDEHHEIGIHTYDALHRGQGLATAMATSYIRLCLERGYLPHWTTEDFRKDSIAIAQKLGFEKGKAYRVYYAPIQELLRT
ncbi:hypothetical protein ASD24_13990 [Paenibacillus sp. Root52]|uniref:GNAT family N-acetyltransferase n=1 Tax=Paenibacillus sp. Root52 TaxID=1736552 RepID=UPI0006F80261|nr:GNAT family N-acetyltransferase [Paenibacillus sp. Root52]KQY83378.1 hypothetical protein ASD24_13990 [Paenibacillus sp. Root52]